MDSSNSKEQETVASTLKSPVVNPKGKDKVDTSLSLDTEVSNVAPPKRQKRKPPASGSRKSSAAWDHFTKLPDMAEPTAQCNYCGKRYMCNPKTHGTSNLVSHLTKCPKYPYALVNDPKQQVLGFEPKKDGGGSNMVKAPQVYDIEECRRAIAIFVITDELPFKIVEGYGFKYLCSRLQPQLHIPSRVTIAKDCHQLYLDEKLKLRSFLQSNCARICLTTDCWTSIQNLSYMVLTAHFVDNDWKLQKKILNFCPIPNHKGETIGRHIELCLSEWGIEKVFTVTVDNASANDVAIAYLRKRMKTMNGLVLDGDFMHIRCCAHIFNLVVNEGLKEMHSSIASIRNAVKYVRSSPSRLAKFKWCVEQLKIASQCLVCLDVPTRWNSTFLMLEAAEKFEKAFNRLEDDETAYIDYFDDKTIGPPSSDDWNNARIFIQFLKVFYDVTLELSGSLYVTSNRAFPQLALVQSELLHWSASDNSLLNCMATEMKKKFDKYWGKVENINPLLFIANILDPRYKLAYLKWSFDDIYDAVVSYNMVCKVKSDLQKLYEWYRQLYDPKSASNVEGQSSMIIENVIDAANRKPAQKAREAAFKSHLRAKDSIEAKNEVERYLAEPCVDADDSFDALEWWKSNVSRFQVLSMVARDVLAIPVSTVASESAFSTGGRVLDVFRSSLSPRMAEALICTQNWLKPNLFQFDINDVDFVEELLQCEKLETELAGSTSK